LTLEEPSLVTQEDTKKLNNRARERLLQYE